MRNFRYTCEIFGSRSAIRKLAFWTFREMIYRMHRKYLQDFCDQKATRASASTRVAQQYHLSPTEPPSDDWIDDNNDDDYYTRERKKMNAMILERAEAEAGEKKNSSASWYRCKMLIRN